MLSDHAGRRPPAEPWPRWGPFGVTLVLLLVALLLIDWQRLDGLAGAIIGSVTTYWLPSRRPADTPV